MPEEPRIRLYQYVHSPFCIPIEWMLRHSGVPYEVVNLNFYEPSPVVTLTHGQYYQVPVIEDLLSREVIWDQGADGLDVAQHIDAIARTNLFPAELAGVQEILTRYIDHDCEGAGFKIGDAYYENWIKTDLERGLFLRHKERKFGVGCVDQWRRDVAALTANFFEVIKPFEHMLGKTSFLIGERPTYADYALAGVIANFLYCGVTSLPGELVLLSAWYARMKAGEFPKTFDEIQIASQEQFGKRSDRYGKDHILADVSDVEAGLKSLNLRAGRKALDVATGGGHTAVYLASLGIDVTASDITPEMLKRTGELAAERGLSVTLKQHAAEALPYEDSAFDLVTCRVAPHHFSAPDKFVSEAARVLKMYGFLVVIDPVVLDDHPEAGAWLNELEKLRDPSHVRLIRPFEWRQWCVQSGLTVRECEIKTLKMPDINWYLEVANTPEENRKKIMEMVARAPGPIREVYRIGQEDGKLVWYWPRMTLVAGKV
jgi:SAM-dependent methyltransferase/glutathione S-transferase